MLQKGDMETYDEENLKTSQEWLILSAELCLPSSPDANRQGTYITRAIFNIHDKRITAETAETGAPLEGTQSPHEIRDAFCVANLVPIADWPLLYTGWLPVHRADFVGRHRIRNIYSVISDPGDLC